MRRLAVGVAFGALLGLTAGCEPADPAASSPSLAASDAGSTGAVSRAVPTPSVASSAVPSPGGRTALAALAAVPVKGRAPQTGYDREQFGPAWQDVDRNGCDTRNDILARDLTGETFKPGTHDCVVLTGTLAEPYTGATISFRRGLTTSDAIQIDHVVALSDAWQKGAQSWDASRRVAFANDPLNLLAVDGPVNMAKGDSDAATWLPPNRAYRCSYVARQVAVKVRYGLWMTQAEKNAISAILGTCPDQPLPGGTVAAVARSIPPSSATPAPRPAPAPVPPPAAAPAVSYANCAAVRAAGAAPLHRGEAGYSSKLDRDGDGVACE
jgi:hypothetical protein